MNNAVTRRDFLKYSLATGTLLAAGEGLLEDVLAQPTHGIHEVDKLSIWIITDNYYVSNSPGGKNIKRFNVVPSQSVHAEHGLSYFVEATVNGKTSSCMFDYGMDPIGVINNIALLGIDIGKANAFCLSHGHYDHYTAAAVVLNENKSRIVHGTPFYVGEEAFLKRYSLRAGNTEPTYLGQLKREVIEGCGLKIVEVQAPTEIIPGAYFTGRIERVTAYEKVPTSFQVKRGDVMAHDVFPGEQALFFVVKGKGVVLLSACAHSGIINATKQARLIAGVDKVHAVLGGFHLNNAKMEIIEKTIADMKSMKPDHIVPTHCTGFEAIVAFQKEMPNEFILNTAGTQYIFGA